MNTDMYPAILLLHLFFSSSAKRQIVLHLANVRKTTVVTSRDLFTILIGFYRHLEMIRDGTVHSDWLNGIMEITFRVHVDKRSG